MGAISGATLGLVLALIIGWLLRKPCNGCDQKCKTCPVTWIPIIFLVIAGALIGDLYLK